MSVLLVQDFEDAVKTGEDPSIIQDAIDREEAELVHALRGPLVGERTETLHPDGHDGPLYLRRYTDAVEVTDDGSDVDADLIRLVGNGGAIERTDGRWLGTVTVTYTPNDELRVRRALIELVRDIVVPDRDREAGTIRDLDRIASGDQRRARLVRGLRPRVGHTTLRVGVSDRLTPVVLP